MKAKTRKIFILLLVSVAIISVSLPSMKPLYNQTVNREFIEKVESNALSANIKIVQLKYTSGVNSSSIAVSAGASGVIIRKEGDRYFALTANHVISELDDVDKTQIVVLGYDDLDFQDSLNKGEEFIGTANYYMKFPEITVEYTSEKSDLALISFRSDKTYTPLSLAEDNPEYGDKIASMSNPHGKRNVVTAGKIGSATFWDFEDESEKVKYSVITHSSVISEGSSGSALLDEDLDIVGINLGGNENRFHQFVSGMAIPNDQIRAFLEEWNR
jgi:S1-C subfamily serine protease